METQVRNEQARSAANTRSLVDGSVVSSDSGKWFFGGVRGVDVMPGDSIVIPEKFDKETGWTKFMQGAREWMQILANFGLGAAAFKTLGY